MAACIGMMAATPAAAQDHAMDHGGHAVDSAGHAIDSAGHAVHWRMPPMRNMSMPMPPSLMRLDPTARPFLPGAGVDPATLPLAHFREVVRLNDGDTLRLTAGLVRRRIRGRTFVMYGFNEQYPGPLIRVDQGSRITVLFKNEIDLPTAVHWHGIRIENPYDGVPGVTQEPVMPGETFVYKVRFPDAGIYWYHPHHREEIQQDLGLYGNMRVDSPDPDYYSPVNEEQVLMLDDLLIDERGLFPYGRESATHALMGRFGNVLLVNGEPGYHLEVNRGDVVRFFLTNVSNTRTFNLSFAYPGEDDGALATARSREGDVAPAASPADESAAAPPPVRMKLVGADIGKYERERWVENIVIGPAQRYTVEARFNRAGAVALVNRIQAIDHYLATFYPHVDTLGTVTVSEGPTAHDFADAFRTLRRNERVVADIARYREHFDDPPDHVLELTMRAAGLPRIIVQIMSLDTLYRPPVEWNDAMPMMNYLATSEQVEWILRDVETGAENMDIHWQFEEGEVVNLRIHNELDVFHPMQHPIHLHGQRFLVLARDGMKSHNRVWKDTALIPAGSTVDLLVEMSNPGSWMLHCHIAEHLEAGMKTVFEVAPAGNAAAP